MPAWLVAIDAVIRVTSNPRVDRTPSTV